MNEPTDRITLNLAALTDDQRDGFTCVVCERDLATGGPSVPVGTVPGGLELLGGQVFACASHLTDDQRSGLACVVCGRDYLTETTPTPHVPVGRIDGGQVFACTSHVQDATAPALDGWRVTRHNTAPAWTADRRGGLTDVELEYGCALRVTASTFGELEVKCLAEDIKRGIVQAAERLAERMIDAELQRGGRTWRTDGPGAGLST